MKKQPLLNTKVSNVSMDEAIGEICRLVERKKRSYVVAVNVDVIVKAEKDKYLKMIADKADLTLVDGMPLVWISKLYHCPVKAKISGSDLVPVLCAAAAKKRYSIFIIGGAEGVAYKAAERLRKAHEGIKIAGTYSPAFGFEKDSAELKRINTMISAAQPDLVIACFGCPKQEKWIYENYLKYTPAVSVCAGATVDFIAGNVKRAPYWMSSHGLEWLYRFTQEPRRLFKRYFIDDMKILGLIWKYRKERKDG